MDGLDIRPRHLTEADATVALVPYAFDEFGAPDYSAADIAHVYAHVTVGGL